MGFVLLLKRVFFKDGAERHQEVREAKLNSLLNYLLFQNRDALQFIDKSTLKSPIRNFVQAERLVTILARGVYILTILNSSFNY